MPMTLPIAIELPAARTTPIDSAAQILANLAKAERPVVQDALGQQDAFFAVKSRGRTDTGGWLGRRRVWVFALAEELLLVATGKSPYVERTRFADLRGSVYNAVTGELVLAPAPRLRVRRLRMVPLDGYQTLAQVYATIRSGGAS